MTTTRAAKVLDEEIGTHAAGNTSSISNPAKAPAAAADDSGEMMKATCWKGKNDVSSLLPLSLGGGCNLRSQIQVLQVPKPKIMDPEDVIIKITGTTVCGSDMQCVFPSCPTVNITDYALPASNTAPSSKWRRTTSSDTSLWELSNKSVLKSAQCSLVSELSPLSIWPVSLSQSEIGRGSP